MPPAGMSESGAASSGAVVTSPPDGRATRCYDGTTDPKGRLPPHQDWLKIIIIIIILV